MKRLGIALMLVMAACLPAPRSHAWSTLSRVTYYQDAGYTASGEWTRDGGAACGWAIPLGSTVHIIGPDVWLTCDDTGYLGATQVDVYSPWGRPAWMVNDYEAVETW